MFLDILGSGDPEAENVTVVLKALQKSLVFEKEAQARFDDEYGSGREAEEDEGRRRGPQPRTFSAIADDDARRPSEDEAETSLLGALSSVFDPFMGPYVLLERKNMEEMMRKVSAEEQVR